ncbi:hypothetical protein [Halorussus halobius]|uniref:hypothetical protein n=1 Tax=Halorussus halobius TaxID=1710537 RepID=UPI001092AD70|nr:hypothetical protein [Halorussus halobius]
MDWLAAYNGVLVRVGLYLFVFWPTVGYYVYRDATKRELSAPMLRGVAYGVFGIVGLVVYVVRNEN